jgi:hypothetical protein
VSNEPTIKFKGNQKPWYIMGMENKMLNVFRIATGICALPSVIMNLCLIAFGVGNFPKIELFIELLEILFFAEII